MLFSIFVEKRISPQIMIGISQVSPDMFQGSRDMSLNSFYADKFSMRLVLKMSWHFGGRDKIAS